MPNEKKIDETEQLIAEACRKLRNHSSEIVDTALDIAREARDSRPSQQRSDLTGKFAAIVASMLPKVPA